MRAIVARIRFALLTRPSGRDWLELAVGAAVFAICGSVVGLSTGLLHFAPRDATEIVRVAGIALIAPALSEDLIFRGAMIPGRGEGARAFAWIMASTALFTLWHVVETSFLPAVQCSSDASIFSCQRRS